MSFWQNRNINWRSFKYSYLSSYKFLSRKNGVIKIKFSNEVNDIETVAKLTHEYYISKKSNPENKSPKNEITQLFIECLACCQGATKVKDKLIGDPLDVEIFQSTGWELIEDPKDNDNYNTNIFTYVRLKKEKSLKEKMNIIKDKENYEKEKKNILEGHYESGIVKRFDFESKLQRMSTIAKNLSEENYISFCKGSPEKIYELYQRKTIPDNFNEILTKYTSKGFRVLALSFKLMKISFEQAKLIPRESVEKDLIFLRLLIVHNKLKESTKDILKTY